MSERERVLDTEWIAKYLNILRESVSVCAIFVHFDENPIFFRVRRETGK